VIQLHSITLAETAKRVLKAVTPGHYRTLAASR